MEFLLTLTLFGNNPNDFKDGDDLNKFTFNASGDRLLLLFTRENFNFYLYIWNVQIGKEIYNDQGFLEYSRATSAAFRPDGRQAAVLVFDTVRIVDMASGQVQKEITLTDTSVNLSYSADGTKLITTAGVFDIESGTQVNDTGFSRFQLSPNGQILAGNLSTDGEEQSTLLWDISRNKKITSIPEVSSWRDSVFFSPGGDLITSFDKWGNLRVHAVQTGQLLHQFTFGSDLYAIAFAPQSSADVGSLLAVGEDTGRVQVWDMVSKTLVNTFLGSSAQRRGKNVDISPDGKLLAFHAQPGGVVQIVDIFSGQVLRNLTGGDLWIYNLAFSPDDQYVVAISDNYDSLLAWDLKTGQLLKTSFGRGGAFQFFPNQNSQLVFAAGNRLIISDIATDKTIAALVKQNPIGDEVYEFVAVSADGQLIAAGTSTALVDIWDVEKRQLVRTLKGHEAIFVGYDGGNLEGIKGLAFNPYNHLLASTGIDCTIRVWNADNGELLQILIGTGPVAFSPDGTVLTYSACYGAVDLAGLPETGK